MVKVFLHMRVASFIARLGSQFTHCEELWSPWPRLLDGWSLPLYLLSNGLSELVHIFNFLIYRGKVAIVPCTEW